MAWDDDKKAQAVKMYQDKEPTPETSMDIVKDIAEELGESANGVRMILTKANVYVKKEAAAGKTTEAKKTSGGAAGGTRVSKEDSHKSLVDAIEAHGQSADTDIISKLTGKAAVYFASVFNGISK